MQITTYGRIFDPQENLISGYTHASYPVAISLPGETDKFRVFYSARDLDGRSHVFWTDFQFNGSVFQILSSTTEPVLSPGARGLFDCDGISVGNIVTEDKSLRMYYLGWMLQKNVPWMNTIGVATSYDSGNSFEKNGRVPILDRSEEDPFSMSYPWVQKSENEYHIWYGSNQFWGETKSDMGHHIKSGTSKDGLNWKRNAKPILPLSDDMTAMSRPSVLKIGEKDYMLLSIKNKSGIYSIWLGAKDATDNWHFTDLEIRSTGQWDADYRSYGSFFTFDDEVFILYNGNGFGKTGFGIVKLKL